MKVKIGNTIIPDAEVERFIDLQSGLALSMIQVSCEGEPIKELEEAFQKNILLPFECAIIKTNVLVHGASHRMKEKKHAYTLFERAVDVPCGYKLIHTKVGNEKAIIVPENTKDMPDMEVLRKLPFIRFILKKDIPEELFKNS